MANMSHHNQDHTHQTPDPKPDVPMAVDSRRCPQLDTVKSRDRCGCACASSRGNGEDGGDGGGTTVPDSPIVLPLPLVTTPNIAAREAPYMHGDEGVEPHSIIEVGDLGTLTLREILAILVRHGRLLPELSLDAESTRYTSIGSPTVSMLVEGRSESDFHSSRSSASLATRSTSSGQLVIHAGATFEGHDMQHPIPRHFITDPMWLGHELDFCSNMIIGQRYPLDLNMSEDSSDDEY